MRASKSLCLVLLVFATAFSQAVAQTQQYSIGNPTNEQQYMLELINRARANGGSEATRLGLSGLQEGPPTINGQVWTIQNSVQPLSWNPLLFNCAQNHATNLNNNDQFFSGQSPHTFGGTTPQQRIAAAGYSMASYNGPTNGGAFPGPENVAEAISFGTGPYTGAKLIAEILNAHNDLFTDQSVAGRGHRSTTMLAFFREIGIGISVGTDVGPDSQGTIRTWESLYIVQNFGAQTNSTPFITGVVYQDANGNAFYDPGEGVGGVRIDVTGSDFFAISSSSGGYSVPVPSNGSYTVTFSGGGLGNYQQTANVANLLNAKVDYNPSAAGGTASLANIATRLRVETGDNILIAGLIITGNAPKKIMIRAIGPSLTITDKLANPILELRDGSGALLEANDNWVDSANKQAIIDSTIPPTHDLESAIVRTVPAGSAHYTALVRGVNNGTGVAVVEVYDLNTAVDSKLANISTRGLVQTGDNVLFAGTIVLGPGSQNVLLRALGPSLPSNVPGKMGDPTLELRDANGSVLEANDDWNDSPNRQAIIDTTIPPPHDRESAIVRPLPANGARYTAIVRGFNNSTGIAVVEVYALQ